ncbi:hypothetical protein H6G89_21665 [Oscillatoria sp. FACHB-1407]|uniref:hypothetical protein n=1 Tax=Oscillatoria sp. FACHB-1407 TaxID=2692847 RepID=UPI001681E5CF|nr:hypothetical protein [Oscillatoria sp. FACHB-1407]MBD2463613.1 hypothetical protein [Oscillatoria sp. FACHB-1407]
MSEGINIRRSNGTFICDRLLICGSQSSQKKILEPCSGDRRIYHSSPIHTGTQCPIKTVEVDEFTGTYDSLAQIGLI